MEREEVKRKTRDRKREEELLKLLNVDDSGFVIYPGPGPIRDRTGSPAYQLINWFLYKDGDEKPLDFPVFVQIIKEK